MVVLIGAAYIPNLLVRGWYRCMRIDSVNSVVHSEQGGHHFSFSSRVTQHSYLFNTTIYIYYGVPIFIPHKAMEPTSQNQKPNGRNSVHKAVRFSPSAPPTGRTQPLSGSNQSQSPTSTSPAHETDSFTILSTYIEQSRALLENQRILFAQERELWEKERALLRSRIAELESLLKREEQGASSQSRSQSQTARGGSVRFALDPFGSRDAASTKSDSTAQRNGDSQAVWEGSDRPTRVGLPVFAATENQNQNQLSPPQSRGRSSLTSLDDALSPRLRPVTGHGPHSLSPPAPVPIERLDNKLVDGIALKSTALPPELATRIVSPPASLPEEEHTSPSPRGRSQRSPSRNSRRESHKLRLRPSDLRSPLDNLTREAGHTPMVTVEGETEAEADQRTPTDDDDTPRDDETSITPAATRKPSEASDTYFPEPSDDPSLKGPLSLINDEEHDNSFLQELNEKLLKQNQNGDKETEEKEEKETAESSSSGPVDGNSQGSSNYYHHQEGESSDAELTDEGCQQVPELRFRETSNFGTAFGVPLCGLGG